MSLLRNALIVGLVASLGIIASACGSGSADEPDKAAPAATTATPAETTTTEAPADPDAAKFEVPAAGSGDGVKIGYISLGDQVPFVKLVSDDIRAEAKVAGAKLVFCDSQLDGAKALDCAKNFKTQDVDAIINFQVDEKSAPRICAA